MNNNLHRPKLFNMVWAISTYISSEVLNIIRTIFHLDKMLKLDALVLQLLILFISFILCLFICVLVYSYRMYKYCLKLEESKFK